MRRFLAFLLANMLVLLAIACSETTLHTDWPHAPDTGNPNAAPAISLFAPRNELNANATSYQFIWGSSIPYITTIFISENPDLSSPLFEQDFASASRTNFTPPTALPLTGGSKKRIYWAVRGVDALHTVWSETNVINPELDPYAIVISEVCYKATKSDSGQGYYYGDFIELHNTTLDRTIDIGNWHIDQFEFGRTNALGTITVPYGTRLSPGGFFVIANTSSQFDNAFETTAFRVSRVKLDISSSKGFSYILRDLGGLVRDECDLNASKFPTTTEYKSIERAKPFADGMSAANWQQASSGTNVKSGFKINTFATPGAANSIWPN